jgi:hypothetical protein
MHSRNPSEVSNILKDERMIEEREEQEWSSSFLFVSGEALVFIDLHICCRNESFIRNGIGSHTT